MSRGQAGWTRRRKRHNGPRGLLLLASGGEGGIRTLDTVYVDLSHFGIKNNPISETKPLEYASERLERVLRSMELGHFWSHLTRESSADSLRCRFLRLTILLGRQRRVQLLRARTTDVNIDSATIKLLDNKGRRKTPRVHLLPLTTLALQEISPLLEECRAPKLPHLFHSSRTDCPLPIKCCRMPSGTSRKLCDLRT